MRKKSAIGIGVLLIISLFIFLNSSSSPISFTTGIFQTIFSAPKAALYNLKTGSSTTDNKELAKLQDENKKLAEQMVEYGKIKRENDALRSQFEAEGATSSDLLPARVVGSLGKFNAPHTLIVDKGSTHGVKNGAGVVINKNLVGKVGEVGENYAQIMLVTNSEFTTIGMTNEGATRGIVHGFEDGIVLERVVITDTLRGNDIVVTRGDINGQGVGIEPDLIIGKVVDINKNETQPFQTARVESPIHFEDLDYVFVSL